MPFVPDKPAKSRFVPDVQPPDVQARSRLIENGMPVFPDMPGGTAQESPKPSMFASISDYLRSVNEAAGKVNETSYTREGGNRGPIGTMEALGSMASSIPATFIGSLSGIGTEAARGLGMTGARGEDIAEKVSSALTYKPRSQSGQAKLGLIGTAAAPITESGADIALMPLAMEGRVLPRAPKEKRAPIPTTEELRAAKNAAYKAGNESSILTSPKENAAAIAKIDEALRNENLVVDPDLHPKSTALLNRLRGQKDKPLTVPEAESLRQLALEVERDVDPVTKQPTADAYRAGVILDELDNSLETLSPNKPARELNSRFRRSQMIDEMIRRAEIRAGANYTQAGMEHALRQEFKTLALNPRRMRGLTMEQKAAIEKVAKGGSLENGLRNLGKFDPTTGGMAAFIGTGAGGAIGGAIGGLAGGGIGTMALPAAGFLAKRGATKMTAKNVERAREALVGRQPAGLLGNQESGGLLGGVTRSATQIRSDLRALDAQLQSLPPGEALNSPRKAALLAELARLQDELSRAESQGVVP
jgi:hypothetical protein